MCQWIALGCHNLEEELQTLLKQARWRQKAVTRTQIQRSRTRRHLGPLHDLVKC